MVSNRPFFVKTARFGTTAALAACVALYVPQPALACTPDYGDMNGDGQMDVNDAQCLILAALAEMAGASAEPPSCLQLAPSQTADMNCSGAVNATDVTISIAMALGSGLGSGLDWDADGCPDVCQGAVPCGAVAELSCGQTVTVDTNTGVNLWGQYGCAPWDESGKELRYVLPLQTDAQVSVALTNFSAGSDLDVFILGLSCTPTECLASGDNTANANLAGGGSYLVVVDGFEGSVGTASLTVTCTIPCDNANPCAGGKCGLVVCGDEAIDCGGCGAGLVCGPENACVQQPAGPSCVGACGVQSQDGCWCDDLCFGFGDCCPDVCTWCAGTFPAQCAVNPVDCGNGVCEAQLGETCSTCAADCGCTGGAVCQGGTCVAGGGCTGACGGQSPDGCWCDNDCFGFGDCCTNVCQACGNEFPNQCGGPVCGNGTCEAGETPQNCPADCPVQPTSNCCSGQGGANVGCDSPTCTACICAADAFCCATQWDGICASAAQPGAACGAACPCGGAAICGNGVCETGAGETSANCAADCAAPTTCGDGVCSAALGEDSVTCAGDCPGPSNCCFANGTPGCDKPACQDCVCGADPFCCETGWDDICAAGALDPGCAAVCGCGTTPCGDGTCNPNVGETDVSCPEDCELPVPTCGDGVCEAGESTANCPQDCGGGGNGNCCASNDGPGCNLPACEACVCPPDPFCCQTAWDSACAEAAASTCLASCGCNGLGPVCGNGTCETGETQANCPADCASPPAGCCTSQNTAGCPGNATCQSCVCGPDPFCCNTQWDGICAGAATGVCNASCGCH